MKNTGRSSVAAAVVRLTVTLTPHHRLFTAHCNNLQRAVCVCVCVCVLRPTQPPILGGGRAYIATEAACEGTSVAD